MNIEEHREHTRIEADLACVVDGKVHGRIRNLSIGGALVRCPTVDADIDDTIAIEFKGDDGGEPIRVVGEVVRIAEVGDKMYAEYGLQLVAVEPAPFVRFFRCIDSLMAGAGGGLRHAPRLYKRVELRCRTTQVFHATMNNISRGGMGLECTVPVTAGEKISIEVFMGRLDATLGIPGVVTHVESIQGGIYLAGVCFEEQPPEQLRRLEELLQSLLRGW